MFAIQQRDGPVADQNLLIRTLKREKTTCWWALERTGKPFLLVRKMLVGSMAALIGSPSHFSITTSDGMSAPISTAAGKQRQNELTFIVRWTAG